MKKIFNKNFNILIFGQIISIIGNSTLNFVLGLYLLETSGSATTFGISAALAALPWAIFGPFGGILADKYNKRNIMVILDILCFAFVLLIMYIDIENSNLDIFLLTTIIKFILTSIQAMYSPSVTSAIVVIVEKEHLLKANAISEQVVSLSRIVAPLLAGLLYSYFSLKTILLIASLLYLSCAIVECFMKIEKNINMKKGLSHDNIFDTLKMLIKEYKALTLYLIFSSILAGVLNGLITVGIPFLINVYLGLSANQYSLSITFISFGTFISSILIIVKPLIFKLHKLYIYYFIGILFTIIVGLSLFIVNVNFVYIIVLISGFVYACAMGVIYIVQRTYIQKNTPQQSLAKTMSLIVIIFGFFDPLGQIVIGVILDSKNWNLGLLLIILGILMIPLLMISQKFVAKCPKK